VKVTLENLVRQELVGMSAHIVEARDPSLVCRTGTIVDESKETFRLATADREIAVPKSICVFGLKLSSGDSVNVDGHLLRGRPEDRLKKTFRRR
jgi:ribonuclease P protein subunit POP4